MKSCKYALEWLCRNRGERSGEVGGHVFVENCEVDGGDVLAVGREESMQVPVEEEVGVVRCQLSEGTIQLNLNQFKHASIRLTTFFSLNTSLWIPG
ncbi:hypothetical protein ACFX1Z_024333 [Malus domestica]